MADPVHPRQRQGHLDATGPRDVVYCHQCDHEWYQDEHGLVCPNCTGDVTEIITPESDPRPTHNTSPSPPSPPDYNSLRDHNPWPDSDPEEADIEEHITHGPGGSVFISQTIRSRPRVHTSRRVNRSPRPDTPNEVMRDFQQMLGTLMGPGIRQGQAGRSGPNDLFPASPFGGGFRLGGGGPGPHVVGGRFTYTTGPGLRPRNADGPHDGGPPVEDLATLLGNIFGAMGPRPGEDRRDGPGGMPAGLPGLFATLLNPANARHGDAVYSQEALDQIISNLMEQHPTSNAPGPASPDAIAALPKKKLDEKLLGPEGKGECSVCMDDVHIGDEVVSLPCSHWFHEQCASAWLSEHNTCPICRKGINGEAASAEGSGSNQTGPTSTTTRNEHRSRRLSQFGNRSEGSNRNAGSSRNEARLNSIRNAAGLSAEEPEGRRRWQVVGDQPGNDADDYTRRMPGSFRRRDSEISESQRDIRRGNTSGSDLSRESRRSSHSGNGNGSGGGTGAMAWLRDRFSRHD